MDELSRRAFCTLVAASAALTAGCPSMTTPPTRKRPSSQNRTVVTTRTELEAAFDTLSQGDTIHITAANAPYRTTRWLDVDVDSVTVTGPGVRTLITPAPGANVGGIRIGHNRRCREIDVRGIGYHGNPEGQSQSAIRLHGIAVRNAENVTLTRNHVRKTHPQRHGDGGSGISVARPCSGVRIFDNRIHAYGDRGIQLAGTHITVFGNVITNGLDRPIACDLWYPDQRNKTAQNISLFGNLLGNSYEGSLVGVARNKPIASNRGFLSIFGNVGFGSHKSFCHIRGPAALQNISVQNNVSLHQTARLQTEATKQFAGIAVDVETGGNLSIKNNELFDYSGHGIRVESTVTGLNIQQNSIAQPGLAGVRLAGATDGIVSNNLITQTGEAGIRLKQTANISARDNTIRRAGTAGIITEGRTEEMDTDITGNFIAANGHESSRSFPAILIRNSGVGVRGNTIKDHPGAAIVEGEAAGNNFYADNRADGDQPWQISAPGSSVRNHHPPIDVHQGMTTGPDSDVVSVAFDRPYARPPRLTFGRTGGGIRERTYKTDRHGNYVGVTITTQQPDSTVDVFVD